MQLEGRRILVTGASSGIGRAIAQLCVAQGARVLATGRRAEALEELDGVRRYVCDLRDPGAPAACVAEAVERLGGLDGVVHAAGTVLRGQDPRSSSDEEIDGILLDNLAVPQRVARAALGALGERRLAGAHLEPARAHRRSRLLELLRRQGRGRGARARARGGGGARRHPRQRRGAGLVRTPMAYLGRENFDELVPAIAERHPLRRIGEAEDIAGPVAFLLSDASAWMTGADDRRRRRLHDSVIQTWHRFTTPG